jgi:hypothetical protein
MAIDLTVNGAKQSVEVAPETPLLWVIRDQLGLTGTKFSCGIAQCGACTLHVDGRPLRSCTVPVSAADGKTVTTIEGLSADGTHPVHSDRCGDRRRGHQCVPLQHLSPHPSGNPTGRLPDAGRREGSLMTDNDLSKPGLSRRDLLSTGAAATGALVAPR